MNYLQYEYELYQHIFNEAKCLWKYDSYSTLIDPRTIDKNSQYLSYKIKTFFDISELNGVDEEIKTLHQLYNEAYENYEHVISRGYPERFPVIFDTNGEKIEHCMIRFEDAISSRSLQNIKSPITLKGLDSETIKILRQNNIPFLKKRVMNSEGKKGYSYFLSKNWLAENFGEDCQVRIKTGIRFKASFTTETTKINSHAGFYLFNQSFDVDEINFKLRKRKNIIEYQKIPGLTNIEIKPSK